MALRMRWTFFVAGSALHSALRATNCATLAAALSTITRHFALPFGHDVQRGGSPACPVFTRQRLPLLLRPKEKGLPLLLHPKAANQVRASLRRQLDFSI